MFGRHRTKRTKGCLNRDGMIHMMFKLGQCAEKSWRKLRGFAHLGDVIQGVDFINGIKPSNRRMMIAWTPDLTGAPIRPYRAFHVNESRRFVVHVGLGQNTQFQNSNFLTSKIGTSVGVV